MATPLPPCHSGKVEKEGKERGGRIQVAAEKKGKGQGVVRAVTEGSDEGRKVRGPPSV